MKARASRASRSSRRTMRLALGLLAVLATGGAGSAAPPEIDLEQCRYSDAETGEPRIDAGCFFEQLVIRYRNLTSYRDVADVLQVTRRQGERPLRVQTRIDCRVADGKLRVRTPASVVREGMGLGVEIKSTPAMEHAALQYGIWLAPHMALKFTQEPTREFRSGVSEGFTATEAETVQVGEKSMVHLELTSGDGSSEDCKARFDLYVDPESMLVERIVGEQRLPDGARYETSLTIVPQILEEPAALEPETLEPAALEPASGDLPGAMDPEVRTAPPIPPGSDARDRGASSMGPR